MEAFEKNASSLTVDGPDRVMPGIAMIAANRNGEVSLPPPPPNLLLTV